MKDELISAPRVRATAVIVRAGAGVAVGAVGEGLLPPHDASAKADARAEQRKNYSWPSKMACLKNSLNRQLSATPRIGRDSGDNGPL